MMYVPRDEISGMENPGAKYLGVKNPEGVFPWDEVFQIKKINMFVIFDCMHFL